MSRLFCIYTLVLIAALSVKGQTDYDSLYLFRNCLTLDAKESVDEERNDLIYNWQFGDGREGAGQIVEHCYNSLGTYNVTLSIIDPSVLSQFPDEWTFEMTITEDYLISLGINQEDLAITGKSSLTYDNKPENVVFFWDFGDGHYETGEEVYHSYDTAGTYAIRLLAQVKEGDEIIQLATTQTIKLN